MIAFLNEAAAKLERPAPPPVFSPAAMRDLAAIQEAVAIEQDVNRRSRLTTSPLAGSML